jgi:phosphoribosylformimino-5-aminoimidazole carboxamide ribotide isomerase
MEGVAERLRAAGVKTVVYTNVAVDGTMRGPSVALLEHVIGILEMSVIASGGISSLEDIERLKVLESKGLLGVVIGRALYEDRFNLRDAVAVASA